MIESIQKVLNAPIVQDQIAPITVGVTTAGASWVAISEKVSTGVFLIAGIAGAVVAIFTAIHVFYKIKLIKLNYEKAKRELDSLDTATAPQEL